KKKKKKKKKKKGGCGIACEYAGLLHGYTPAKLKEVRTVKWVTGIISLIFIFIWVVNQNIEEREDNKRERCCDKNMLHQSTIAITFFYFATITMYLLPDLVGVNQVLCASNGGNGRVIVCLELQSKKILFLYITISVLFYIRKHILHFINIIINY
ncbi:hypothetical protein RFI_19554, partial [Reticulomyxa filosa]